MTFTSEGKPSGEAFVEFENEEDMEMALEHNNDYLGNRYIEGESFLNNLTKNYFSKMLKFCKKKIVFFLKLRFSYRIKLKIISVSNLKLVFF